MSVVPKTCAGCGKELERATREGHYMAGDIQVSIPHLNLYCDQCWDARQNDAVIEGEQKLRKLAAERWAKVCPTIYRQTDLNRIPQEARDKVLGWKYGPRGLVLGGPTRTFKTRLAVELVRRLACVELKTFRMFFGNQFGHECAQTYGDHQGYEWFKRAADADVLLLDDLGKFKLTERVESELFGLVEERTSWGRPIIVTMNGSGDWLEARMSQDRGKPLRRRLQEFCDQVVFK